MILKLSRLPPDVVSISEPKSMGYAFDDGPNCSHNILYNYLSSQKQKATLFYIGSGIFDWPLEAQRATVLRTAMKFTHVSVFTFLRTCSMEVDFSGGLTDIWSHR
jgi:hypothetical protein